MKTDVVAGTHARSPEVLRQAGGPLVELAVGQTMLGRDHRRPVGHGVSHAFEQLGQVVRRHKRLAYARGSRHMG